MTMSRLILIFILLSAAAQGIQAAFPAPRVADWTVMVFMNAKNNLECAGIANFSQMANIGSSDHVNVVVELGRPTKRRYTNDEGGWTGVLRFRVTQGMHPVEGSAIDPDNPNVRHADMGSGATLSDFVRWSERTYPAKKYILVIWNHGQGWRFYQTLALEDRAQPLEVAYRPNSLISDDEPQPCNGPSGQTLTGGFRSVSFDEDTGSFLYNRDVANSVQGLHIELLGFDACLMAMIESAYAFRDVANIMVASEELVPGDGWNYDFWLRELVNNPDMDGIKLAVEIVRSYKETYKDGGDTTLSAIDLTKVKNATQALARLSLLVKAKMQTEGPILAFTRLSFRTFGDWYADSWQDCQGSKVMRFQSIDLVQFLKLYRRETKNVQIRREIARTEQRLKTLVIASYASSLSAGADHWASGLAIYFPSSEVDYQCDYDKNGYDVEAVRAGCVQFPPEFVELEGWADLLHEYLLSRASPSRHED
jgi:hypothetical protein